MEEPLTHGVPRELIFDMMPISVIFEVGSRLRVTVTSADKDTFRTPVQEDPPLVTIFTTAQQPSRINLPVIRAPGWRPTGLWPS